jgi:hypothetical protein
VRRKFYELAEISPVAADVLRRIAALFAIEDEIRDLSADERRRVRDQRSRPLALNRKNALFAGSHEGGDNLAVIATLIGNCKLTWAENTAHA